MSCEDKTYGKNRYCGSSRANQFETGSYHG